MSKIRRIFTGLISVLGLSLLGQLVGHAGEDAAGDALRASMVAKKQAGLDRLDQSELQEACSNPKDLSLIHISEPTRR